MIAEGDPVALSWHMVDGDKRYNGITINRVAAGKIVEDWFCYDEIAKCIKRGARCAAGDRTWPVQALRRVCRACTPHGA